MSAKVDSLLKQTCEWLRGTGPNSDIVLSSRVRLARNIEKAPFPHWATKKQEKETLETLEEAVRHIDLMKGSLFVRLSEIDDVDKQFLLERHSHWHRLHAIQKNRAGAQLLLAQVHAQPVHGQKPAQLQVGCPRKEREKKPKSLNARADRV